MYTTGSSICTYFHPKTANGKKTVTVKEPSEDTDEDDEVPKFASWIIRFFSVTWPDAGYCKPVIEKAVAGFRILLPPLQPPPPHHRHHPEVDQMAISIKNKAS